MERRVCTNLWPVSIFTLSYLLGATYMAQLQGNWEFMFYVFVVSFLIAIALSVHHKVGLSSGALWLLSVWGLMHMLGGILAVPQDWTIEGTKHVLYSWWIFPGLLKYDHVVHAFGFGALTWITWQLLRPFLRHQQATPGVLVLCAAVAMGFGALNEIIEFIAVLLIPETNVGGYENTAWDLVANMVGAVVVSVVIWVEERVGR